MGAKRKRRRAATFTAGGDTGVPAVGAPTTVVVADVTPRSSLGSLEFLELGEELVLRRVLLRLGVSPGFRRGGVSRRGVRRRVRHSRRLLLAGAERAAHAAGRGAGAELAVRGWRAGGKL